ncbi:hypothetical protein BU16DRAFT_564231 [Lophium mytilinum]|uniref:Actin-like ATPase domain-containing protein n=1 Tax=Lophium mytilinum TaxID=390894 RepID=A0A6A6QLD8_9PEZI|nr:hypothetical protein BU16DRAFT_564231 [Lophium mytilinum]
MPWDTSYGTLSPRTRPPPGAPDRILVIEKTRRRRRRCCKKILRSLFFKVLIVLAVISTLLWHFAAFAGEIICYTNFLSPPFPLPPARSNFKNQTFSVGFDLTAGYATAAVLFDNGTIVNVARIEGTPEYNAALTRLSLESSAQTPTPPYYNCTAQLSDLPRQWLRYLRELTHQPASPDAAVLASLLTQLKAATNTYLGPRGPLEQVFLTTPPLPGLYNEPLLDAADAAGIQMLTLPWYIHRSGDSAQYPVTTINAAFAGMCLGLKGLNITTPCNEDSESASDAIFSVLFTKHALAAHLTPLASAPHFYAAKGVVDFTLGSGAKRNAPNRPALPIDVYWRAVRAALREALGSYYIGARLGRVVVYGDAADDEDFNKILREEVLAAQESDEEGERPVFVSSEAVYAGARGAAMFAKLCSGLPPWGSCFPDLRPAPQGW